MYPVTYVDCFLVDNTKYKSIINAWERNDFGIVVYKESAWWLEGNVTDKTYELIKREMKRLFPKLKHFMEA